MSGTRTKYQLQADTGNTGLNVDFRQTNNGTNDVQHQSVVLSDAATDGADAAVKNSAPSGSEYALVVRQVPSQVTSSANIATASTTTFAVNDVWGSSVMTFDDAAAFSGGGGIIEDVIIGIDANQATKLVGRLLLFNAAPANPTDNAAVALSDAEMRTCIASIPFAGTSVTNATSGNGGSCVYHVQGLNIGFKTVSSDSLYGIIVVDNTYVAASSTERIDVMLKIQQG